MTVRKVGKSWVATIKCQRAFPRKGQAFRFYALGTAALARMEQLGDDESTCCTIRDRLDEFLSDCLEGDDRRACNETTAALHRRRLLHFDRVFHSKRLDAITLAEVKAWRKRRRRTVCNGKRIGRDTVNADLGSLKAFVRWAKGRGYAPAALPLDAVGRLQEPGKIRGMNRKPPTLLGIEQVLDVIARFGEVRRDIALFLEGMFLYVLRPAAVAALRRSDVRLPVRGQPGRLEVVGLKGTPKRSLEIVPGSYGHLWVRECLALGGEEALGNDPLVICIGGRSRRNPGGWTTATLDRAVARVCRDLAFPFRFRPYQIRHDTIAWAQNFAGMTLAGIAAGAGHETVVTQRFYDHTTASQARPMFAALDGLLGSRKQPPGGSRGAVSAG